MKSKQETRALIEYQRGHGDVACVEWRVEVLP